MMRILKFLKSSGVRSGLLAVHTCHPSGKTPRSFRLCFSYSFSRRP